MLSLRSQFELKVKTSTLPEARENVGDQPMVGFSFASDWLRGWRKFSGPITVKYNQYNLGLLSTLA